MSNSDRKCPYCKVAMETGVVLDRGHGNSLNTAEWLEGAPERSFWGLKTKGKDRRKIVSYRCPDCGLLQDYAL